MTGEPPRRAGTGRDRFHGGDDADRRGPRTLGDRGQAHTLEAVASAVMLLASVVFALQVTAVTPLTASTASQHIEIQQAGVGEGMLDSAAANGTLEPTVLLFNVSAGQPYAAGEDGVYVLGGPPTTFGANLNETFSDRGIAFKLEYVSIDPKGGLQTVTIVEMGVPSDHGVVATRTITLHDDDPLYYPNGTAQDRTVGGTKNFNIIKDAYDGPLYNVVVVRLTIWRM